MSGVKGKVTLVQEKQGNVIYKGSEFLKDREKAEGLRRVSEEEYHYASIVKERQKGKGKGRYRVFGC